MKKINKIRTILIVIGIFLQAFGFYLCVYSVKEMVNYPIGISLPELFFPYTLEGAILMAIGPAMYWFGYKYKEPVKGQKELIKKMLWIDKKPKTQLFSVFYGCFILVIFNSCSVSYVYVY